MGKFETILRDLDSANGYPSTKYQIDIYRSLYSRDGGNLLVEAVAGSGKSTTIRNGLKFLPDWSKNIIVAFNTHIANAMNESGLPSHTTAGTLNSVCFRTVLKSRPAGSPKVQMERWKTYDILRALVKRRADELDEEIGDQRAILSAVPNNDAFRYDEELARLNALTRLEATLEESIPYVAKVVSLLKGQSAGCADAETINYLVDRFSVEWDDSWLPLAIEAYDIGVEERMIMDFDDQLLFSLDDKCKFDRFDNIFVDESQDLNPLNLDILAKIARIGSTNPSRLIFVGDSNQSIYGFRGADPRAIAEIRTRFATKSLPLNVSWRCGKRIIEAAQAIVPHIEAAPDAEDGEIITLKENDFYSTVEDGDYVLCRITSPLVSKCLKMLARGRKAVVLGREIGTSLISILKKFNNSEYDGLDLLDKITYYQQLELGRLAGRDVRSEAKAATIVDKCEALRAICEECQTIEEAKNKITQLFADDSRKGVTFSTIHKAKGLEADRIFIIRPDLMPLPYAKQDWEREQEENLIYVATTRAKRSLYYVISPKKKKFGESSGYDNQDFTNFLSGTKADQPEAEVRF